MGDPPLARLWFGRRRQSEPLHAARCHVPTPHSFLPGTLRALPARCAPSRHAARPPGPAVGKEAKGQPRRHEMGAASLSLPPSLPPSLPLSHLPATLNCHRAPPPSRRCTPYRRRARSVSSPRHASTSRRPSTGSRRVTMRREFATSPVLQGMPSAFSSREPLHSVEQPSSSAAVGSSRCATLPRLFGPCPASSEPVCAALRILLGCPVPSSCAFLRHPPVVVCRCRPLQMVVAGLPHLSRFRGADSVTLAPQSTTVHPACVYARRRCRRRRPSRLSRSSVGLAGAHLAWSTPRARRTRSRSLR